MKHEFGEQGGSMRKATLFLAGILVGAAIQGVVAQPARGSLALNHVAISVPDLDEGIRFYTKALGLKEAFTFRDDRGRPLSYLQISRDTFLELQQATADRPAGFIHIGLEVGDLRSALPQFRQGGLKVDDPVESARTKALISQAAGPGDLRFELLEFGPDSLQRKVMNAWK
jgi:catechol 2,3-dioxygenase-like lactoylglutathione lyase family enzyme